MDPYGGGTDMLTPRIDSSAGVLTRRGWLRSTGLGVAAACAGDLGLPSPRAAEDDDASSRFKDVDLAEVEQKLHEAGIGKVHQLRSNHYQAIGDAADSFMKSSLVDCEQLALDYLRHFKTRGFEVRPPEHRLILVVLRDDLSFGKFLRIPSLMKAGEQGIGAQPSGVYDRSTNLLNVFDWRNVPMASRSSHRNVQTVAHEGTHQLTFNTGLLNREGDLPTCFSEGLGTYGEPRKVIGSSDLGRLNVQRLDELAKLRRRIDWIPLHELVTNDSIFREGLVDRLMLGYAQSWVLVHYLLNNKEYLPRFRAYLSAVHSRKAKEHRLDDAKEHLGDLDALDRALQGYVVQLLRSL